MDCDQLPNFLDRVVVFGIVAHLLAVKDQRGEQAGSEEARVVGALDGQLSIEIG